jgi:hypothetical protein
MPAQRRARKPATGLWRGPLLFVVLGLLAAPAAGADSPVALIANPDVQLRSSEGAGEPAYLSPNSLRAVFGMRLRTWPDGRPIRVFVLEDDHPVHKRFTKAFLSIFPYQLRRLWDRSVYSGTGQAPNQVGSQEEMRAVVAKTPGAIGYVEADEVDESVHVLEVQ